MSQHYPSNNNVNEDDLLQFFNFDKKTIFNELCYYELLSADYRFIVNDSITTITVQQKLKKGEYSEYKRGVKIEIEEISRISKILYAYNALEPQIAIQKVIDDMNMWTETTEISQVKICLCQKEKCQNKLNINN